MNPHAPDIYQERRGDWFTTFSGITFYPLDPRPEEIEIEDIAHALAHICRYGGHCSKFYSVAQHSVLVSLIVPAHLALLGLMHDATEAYCGDMIRPLKDGCPDYRRVEDSLWSAVRVRFDLPEMTPEIKYADLVALSTERRDLIPSKREWRTTITHPPRFQRIVPEAPVLAKRRFLERFEELT